MTLVAPGYKPHYSLHYHLVWLNEMQPPVVSPTHFPSPLSHPLVILVRLLLK